MSGLVHHFIDGFVELKRTKQQFMVAAGPYLSHATIRAIRVRDRGDWRPRPDEHAAGGKREKRGTGEGRARS